MTIRSLYLVSSCCEFVQLLSEKTQPETLRNAQPSKKSFCMRKLNQKPYETVVTPKNSFAMRKLNQKRYETHSYLKKVFAWENSTKNMRKRRYHDHNDSFWVRKLIQKHHLEGYQSWIRLLASDTRTLKCRVFMNGIWRVYWAVPLAWESHSFIHGYVCRIVIARKSIRFSESCVIAEGWKPQDFSYGSAGFRCKNDTKGSRQRRGRR